MAGLENDSIVDGIRIRLAVFVQGCTHHCPHCHNQQTWDFEGGKIEDTAKIIEVYKKNLLLKGITLTGGEPFEQPQAMYELAKEVRRLGGDVWTYSGYTLEELQNKNNPDVEKLLNETDFLVDGKYIHQLRDLSLNFRGSTNQNIYKRKDKKFILQNFEKESKI